MIKKVTAIPASKPRYATHATANHIKKRRVAAYARVSTDLEEQTSSYEAQIAYYTSYIQGKSDWEFAGMYSDEGISGTSTKRREGFQQMIQDALAGKIDLIITKSVSRFARNTVDSLTYVRTLKEKGVEIYFEKENIWTFDSKGELLITIMSSLAQEESRSISENVTWSHRKRFEAGKAFIPYSSLLGFKKGEDGGIAIDEAQAPTVKLIYQLVLEGHSLREVKVELERRGLKTARGKSVWSISSIRSILTNEKYKGDALLQKTFTVDFLTKESKKNEGEVPQYYVHDNHPAIIDKAAWDEVQYILATSLSAKRSSKQHFLSGRIYCGCCGGVFGSKVWHSTDKYRATIWQCNDKYSGDKTCENTHVTEEEIEGSCVQAINQLLEAYGMPQVLLNAIEETFKTDALTQIIKSKTEELEDANSSLDRLITEQQVAKLPADEFSQQAAELEVRIQRLQLDLAESKSELTKTCAQKHALLKAIKNMSSATLESFEQSYWMAFIDKATVYPHQIVFTTRLGKDISIAI